MNQWLLIELWGKYNLKYLKNYSVLTELTFSQSGRCRPQCTIVEQHVNLSVLPSKLAVYHYEISDHEDSQSHNELTTQHKICQNITASSVAIETTFEAYKTN